MTAPDEPRTAIVSNHKSRRNARRKAKALTESLAMKGPQVTRAQWGAYARDVYDLTRPVPTWADEFRAERAKRQPFAWVVRAKGVAEP